MTAVPLRPARLFVQSALPDPQVPLFADEAPMLMILYC